MTPLSRNPILWSCTVLSIAVVLSAGRFGAAWVRVRSGDEMIRVVGSARRSIRSDFIIWRGTISRQGPDMASTYTALKQDLAKTIRYLNKKKITSKEIMPMAVDVQPLTKTVPINPKLRPEQYNESNTTQEVTGYDLSQVIEIRSEKVDLVASVSREATELISQGLDLKSDDPMYLYTKMSDLKISMQAEAAADAHSRAEKIAQNSNARLGALRYARMSTPQITPLYGKEEDDGGTDDTTSIDKKIVAIVSAGYAIQ